jgi:hypothetical protein
MEQELAALRQQATGPTNERAASSSNLSASPALTLPSDLPLTCLSSNLFSPTLTREDNNNGTLALSTLPLSPKYTSIATDAMLHMPPSGQPSSATSAERQVGALTPNPSSPSFPDWNLYSCFWTDMPDQLQELPDTNLVASPLGNYEPWSAPQRLPLSKHRLLHVDESLADRLYFAQAFKKDMREAHQVDPIEDAELDFDEAIPLELVRTLFDLFWECIHPIFPAIYCPDPACRSPEHFARWPVLYNAMLTVVVRMYDAEELQTRFGMARLNPVSLETLFFNRARYFLQKAGGEPSLQVIQSLLVSLSSSLRKRAQAVQLLAFRENGHGRATQTREYIGPWLFTLIAPQS